MNSEDIKRTLRDHGAEESRFMLAGIAMTERRGRPSMCLDADGNIKFMYADGTVTVGGERVHGETDFDADELSPSAYTS